MQVLHLAAPSLTQQFDYAIQRSIPILVTIASNTFQATDTVKVLSQLVKSELYVPVHGFEYAHKTNASIFPKDGGEETHVCHYQLYQAFVPNALRQSLAVIIMHAWTLVWHDGSCDHTMLAENVLPKLLLSPGQAHGAACRGRCGMHRAASFHKIYQLSP